MKPPPANAFVNQLIALTLLLLVFSGSLGLGAVWARQEISGTANRSHALEVKIADVERRLDEVNAEVAAALNPSELLRQNEVMRIGLVLPREIQVLRVDVAPEFNLARKRNNELFSRTSTTLGDGTAPFKVSFASATIR